MAIENHNSLVSVVNAALSDGKSNNGAPPSGKDPSRVDLTEGHSSVESAVAAINRALNFG